MTKIVHIICERVVCRGEYLGHVDVTGTVKQPGECRNYRDRFVPGSTDNWFIEMIVTESNTPKIEQGYAYFKQIDDGFKYADIAFSEEIDVTGKEVWIMTPEQADLIGETLEMDCVSSMIDREIVEAIEEYVDLKGTITLVHQERWE